MRFAPIPESLPATVPFTGPETLERRRGAPYVARLGANENGFGPSPRAVEAMARAGAEAWKYGDPDNHDLRQALARIHGIAPDNVMPGEGIDSLLGLLVRLIVAPFMRSTISSMLTSAGSSSGALEESITSPLMAGSMV